MLLLEMLECGPGLAEPFLLPELAFLGKVVAQAELLLLPLTIAVRCNVFSIPLVLKVRSSSQHHCHHLEAYWKCRIPGLLRLIE